MRKLSVAGKKAAQTRKLRATAEKAIATMRSRPGGLSSIAKRAAKTRKLRAASDRMEFLYQGK
jgi:hypothetical protein